MQPRGHLSITIFRKQNVKSSILEFIANMIVKININHFKLRAASKIEFLFLHIHTCSHKTKNNELYKQEKGRREVKIPAAVSIDVCVLVDYV